jgi:hypothetical protein
VREVGHELASSKFKRSLVLQDEMKARDRITDEAEAVDYERGRSRTIFIEEERANIDEECSRPNHRRGGGRRLWERSIENIIIKAMRVISCFKMKDQDRSTDEAGSHRL